MGSLFCFEKNVYEMAFAWVIIFEWMYHDNDSILDSRPTGNTSLAPATGYSS